ncbi:MAG: hypothetical protein FJX21_15485, partial [Alphaproteobacteria bacterium]|nr:hypothetical protein [Alphaproteobacteria bacterium]
MAGTEGRTIQRRPACLRPPRARGREAAPRARARRRVAGPADATGAGRDAHPARRRLAPREAARLRSRGRPLAASPLRDLRARRAPSREGRADHQAPARGMCLRSRGQDAIGFDPTGSCRGPGREHGAAHRRGRDMVSRASRAGLALALVLGLATAQAARAQDLVIGVQSGATSIDPHFHALAPNAAVRDHLFDRLVHQDEKQRLIPGLATAWRTIDDLTWEFTLRKGVRFNDGSEFGPEDVIATFRRVPWVPNSPSSYAAFVRPVVNIEVVDPHTLRMRTAAPAPLLPTMLSAVGIVSRKAVEAPTADFNSGKAASGTGPFRFAEF